MRQQMDPMNIIPSAFDEIPSMQPLPLGEALRQLPRQYIKVVLRPSSQTFSQEMRTAGWGIAMVQFCLLIVITVTLHFIGHFIPTSALHSVNAFSTGGWQPLAFLPSPYNAIAFILGSFLIGLGTAYFFSKMWRGHGTFLEHMHGLLLATVPLVTISGVLLLIPATGWLVGALVALVCVLFLYRMLLHVFIVMGVHGLGAGRATLVVLIIPMIVVILFFLVMSLVVLLEGGELIGGLIEGLGWFWPGKKAEKQEKE